MQIGYLAWIILSALVGGFGWILKVVYRMARKEKDIENLMVASHMPPCPASADNLKEAMDGVKELVQHNCDKNDKEHEKVFKKLDELGRGLSWIMGRMGYEEKGEK